MWIHPLFNITQPSHEMHIHHTTHTVILEHHTPTGASHKTHGARGGGGMSTLGSMELVSLASHDLKNTGLLYETTDKFV
jgi:hypothetical protein